MRSEREPGPIAPAAQRARPPTAAELRRLLRASTLLDPLPRRQWLKVVDHLDAADRARLAEILREANHVEPEQPRVGE